MFTYTSIKYALRRIFLKTFPKPLTPGEDVDLNQLLLLGSTVIIACILANRITSRFGIPMLLAFIGLGMAFGSEGLFRIPFDNFRFASDFCTVALFLLCFTADSEHDGKLPAQSPEKRFFSPLWERYSLLS